VKGYISFMFAHFTFCENFGENYVERRQQMS